jgi:hypothetical protein
MTISNYYWVKGLVMGQVLMVTPSAAMGEVHLHLLAPMLGNSPLAVHHVRP